MADSLPNQEEIDEIAERFLEAMLAIAEFARPANEHRKLTYAHGIAKALAHAQAAFIVERSAGYGDRRQELLDAAHLELAAAVADMASDR
ncbi:hypothetical protein [Sphingomonas aquatilis]|uniref:hypothetical protein n=1 Tax=Sphingomonas aquatilis TaxID=93063 RepID=UPI0023F9C49C|nr:hypothetical protein [Sphingomonas aquatilis]MCI4653096.1 hypothetical protein [Sphingomonas aquatilis]